MFDVSMQRGMERALTVSPCNSCNFLEAINRGKGTKEAVESFAADASKDFKPTLLPEDN